MTQLHARFGPSAAARWLSCPGSVTLAERYGLGDTSNTFSREGTFAHEVAARLLEEELPVSAALGWRSSGNEFQVTADWIPFLSTYVDHCRGLVLLEGGEPRIETRVVIDADLDCWGTADFGLLSGCGTRLHISDLKWGQGVMVSAKDNKQLLTYALGFWLGLTDRQRNGIREVHLHVVQPRAGSGQPQTFVVGPEALVVHREEIRAAIELALIDNPPFQAGTHCRFCPAAARCDTIKQRSLQRAKDAFGVPEAQEIAAMLAELPAMETFIKAVRQRAAELAERGVAVPGYKLVSSLGNRTWLDTVDAVNALSDFGIDPYAPSEVRSPAQAENELAKKMKRKDAKELVSKLSYRPERGLTLVPETDQRPAVAPPVSKFLPVAD